MRRLVVLLGLLGVLALVPSAQAQLGRYIAAGAEPIELEDGRGLAVFRSRDGALLGTLARGRLTVKDSTRGARTSVRVSGCDKRWRPARRTSVCAGRGISFSILDGSWRATVRGAGINASAVVRGSVTLEGTEGTYSIANGEERSWPRQAATFFLGD